MDTCNSTTDRKSSDVEFYSIKSRSKVRQHRRAQMNECFTGLFLAAEVQDVDEDPDLLTPETIEDVLNSELAKGYKSSTETPSNRSV